MGRVLTQYRAGVTSEGLKHNKYRSRCYGRGACERKGGCDIHAAFDSPTGLIYPAMDTGSLTLRTNAVVRKSPSIRKPAKRAACNFIDSQTMKDYAVRAKVVVLAASTLESTRLLLLSKSRLYPKGLANSSGHVGHNFCEHVMGPGVTGRVKDLVAKPSTLDDGRPGGFYLTRFRNLSEKHRNSSAATGLRRQRLRHVSTRDRRARFRRILQRRSPQKSGCLHQYGRFRRGPGALRKLRGH